MVEITGSDQDVATAFESITQRFCNSSGNRGYADHRSGQQRDYGSSRGFSQNCVDNGWDNAPQSFQPPYKSSDWEESYQPSANTYVSTTSFDKPKQYNNKNSSYQNEFRSSYSNDNKTAFRNYDTVPTETPSEEVFEPIDWDKANAEADAARKVRWDKCPIMVKDFYVEHPDVNSMTQEQADQFRKDNKNIVVSRTFAKEESTEVMPNPTTKFVHAFEKFPDLMAEIAKAGFEKPSPIQSQMWPILLSGADCIGIAQTGTGKTLAFLLPALIHTVSFKYSNIFCTFLHSISLA